MPLPDFIQPGTPEASIHCQPQEKARDCDRDYCSSTLPPVVLSETCTCMTPAFLTMPWKQVSRQICMAQIQHGAHGERCIGEVHSLVWVWAS